MYGLWKYKNSVCVCEANLGYIKLADTQHKVTLDKMHLPGMNYAGPGTRSDLELDSFGRPKPDSLPIDRVDEAAYAAFPDTKHVT